MRKNITLKTPYYIQFDIYLESKTKQSRKILEHRNPKDIHRPSIFIKQDSTELRLEVDTTRGKFYCDTNQHHLSLKKSTNVRILVLEFSVEIWFDGTTRACYKKSYARILNYGSGPLTLTKTNGLMKNLKIGRRFFHQGYSARFFSGFGFLLVVAFTRMFQSTLTEYFLHYLLN